MRRSKESRTRKQRNLILIALSLGMLFIGYYILNFIATMEKPPLGDTFNIILGCVLIAVSGLIIFLILKKMFFPKKRSNRSNQVFLKKSTKQS